MLHSILPKDPQPTFYVTFSDCYKFGKYSPICSSSAIDIKMQVFKAKFIWFFDCFCHIT